MYRPADGPTNRPTRASQCKNMCWQNGRDDKNIGRPHEQETQHWLGRTDTNACTASPEQTIPTCSTPELAPSPSPLCHTTLHAALHDTKCHNFHLPYHRDVTTSRSMIGNRAATAATCERQPIKSEKPRTGIVQVSSLVPQHVIYCG